MLEQAIIVRAIASHAGASSGCLSPMVHKPRIQKIYGKRYSPGNEVTYHCQLKPPHVSEI